MRIISSTDNSPSKRSYSSPKNSANTRNPQDEIALGEDAIHKPVDISRSVTVQSHRPLSNVSVNDPINNPEHEIVLFIKAGSDRECIGCDPFSQRLFMILWLKGIVFNVTTVDKNATPKELKDIAPGTPPPFLLFNGEVLTDVIKIEDFLEQELTPPNYPRLKCRFAESTVAGNDVFHKFSAWIKDEKNQNKFIQDRFINSLKKLNNFLMLPLGYPEEPINAKTGLSYRSFLDGDAMTLADCNMLPKLHIMKIAGRMKKNWEIPKEFEGIHRYLKNAESKEEFKQTCADDIEIDFCYGGLGKRPRPSVIMRDNARHTIM